MFQVALQTLDLIYHSTVRSVRQSHRNAVMAIIVNVMQTVIFVAVFYVMFSVLGMKRGAVRGDFLMFLLSGIFLYLTHIKAVGAVASANTATNQMLLHAPLNSLVLVCSSALSNLYTQFISLVLVLTIYHIAVTPVEIDDWRGAVGMFFLAWFSGLGVGAIVMAITPWMPGLAPILKTIYVRANMIASGKMFLANSLPGYMIDWFDWNPLFHIIDQARGYVFLNYNPHFSNWVYAVWVSLALIVLGMLGEFYTRKHASLSWGATR